MSLTTVWPFSGLSLSPLSRNVSSLGAEASPVSFGAVRPGAGWPVPARAEPWEVHG